MDGREIQGAREEVRGWRTMKSRWLNHSVFIDKYSVPRI